MDSLQHTGYQVAVKQCFFSDESLPKNIKVDFSIDKVMATVFWEALGIIHMDYLQRWRTISVMPVIGPVQRRFEEKMNAFGKEENAFPPR